MTFSKTPTALLLTEKGELHKFGHAAVEMYAKQAISKTDCKKLLYFDKFKLLLHSKEVSLGRLMLVWPIFSFDSKTQPSKKWF